jgi:ribosomal protein L37AE/L43A
MEALGNQIMPKLCSKYYCEFCHYNTSKKSSFTNHMSSAKHNKTVFGNDLETLGNQIMPNLCSLSLSLTYQCSFCNKEFKNRSGLWKHKQKCNNNKETNTNSESKIKETEAKELIQYLMKENSEFKQLIIEQNKQMIELAKNSGNNNHNTTNSNNSFNLNLFLNETCKNAMNIMDFVNQLQVGIKDLEDTGRLGFSEGISKIIINGLKQMDISDRPLHCSDSKRETIYIKDNDQWNKESEDKTILTNAIKHVAHKNMKKISEWTKEHPEFNDSSSKQNDKYLKIVSESMSGSSQEETNKNYNKIIKNIAKETIIDK